jgi:regulator of replication initiation timing
MRGLFPSSAPLSVIAGPRNCLVSFAGRRLRPRPSTTTLNLLLGGAVVHRCDNCIVLNAALQFAEKLRSFVSEYRFSDTISSSKSGAPLGAGCRWPSFPANGLIAERTCLLLENQFFRSLLERAKLRKNKTRCDNCVARNAALQFAEKTRSFVSGCRFSDTISFSKSDAPLGAGRRWPSFSASCLVVERTCLSLENQFFRSLLEKQKLRKNKNQREQIRTSPYHGQFRLRSLSQAAYFLESPNRVLSSNPSWRLCLTSALLHR